jgi:hypothetical protein
MKKYEFGISFMANTNHIKCICDNGQITELLEIVNDGKRRMDFLGGRGVVVEWGDGLCLLGRSGKRRQHMECIGSALI